MGAVAGRTTSCAQATQAYVVDQPARARSGQFEDSDGGVTRNATATDRAALHRTAGISSFGRRPSVHTQWPGTGRKGAMPVFDQFYASQVASLSMATRSNRLNQAAGAALLDRIGPAIVLVHSQSGPFGWLIGDTPPKLVKGYRQHRAQRPAVPRSGVQGCT